MHDELTKKDIEKMEAEIEHRKLVGSEGSPRRCKRSTYPGRPEQKF